MRTWLKSRSKIGPFLGLNTLMLSLGVLVILAMAGLAYIQWRQYRAARATGIRVLEVQSSIENLVSNLLDAETGQRGFLLTGEARYLEPYNGAVQVVPAELARLDKLLRSPQGETNADVARLKILVDQMMTELRETIELRRNQGIADATEAVLSDQGKQAMDEIRRICLTLRRQIVSERSAVQARALAANLGSLLVTAIGSLILLLLLVAGYVIINSRTLAREEALLGMRSLHELGMRLMHQSDLHSLLGEILHAARTITGADMGNIQLLDASGALRIEAHHGFSKEFLDFFKGAREGEAACGTALARRERIVVEDVERSPIFAGKPALKILRGAGARAVQSTPLISHGGVLVGMLSTHYRRPRQLSQRDLHLIDLLARQAADLIEKRRAEEALRESEELYRATFDNAAIGIAHVGLDGRWLRFNDAVCAITGYSREELSAKTFGDITHPDDLKSDWEQARRVAAGEIQTYSMEKRYIRKDGAHVWVNLTVSLLRDIAGAPKDYISVIEDITQEKRAAEQLRAADERLRALVANSSDGVALLDAHGTVLFSGAPILGYGNDEWHGRNGMDVLHPEDKPAMLQKFAEIAQQSGSNATVRYRARHKDGSWRWIEAICRNLLGEPAVRGIVVNYRDITQQRQIEESLREQAQLLDMTQDAVLALRWDGTIEFWNRGAAECYGWRPEEAIGQVAHDLFRTEFPEPLSAIKHKLARDGYWQGELVHSRRDGSRITVSSRWALRRGANDPPSGYLEITTDITERKRVEEQLRQTQRLESLGVLAGGIAHDFNNLLVAILGNASLALDVLGPSTPARRMLEDLIAASERAANLTRQMLAYAGKERLATEPVSLSTLIKDLSGLLRTSIPKSVHLALDLQEPLPHVTADQTQLQQVIMNMVINGAEAIPENSSGVVKIATATRKPTAQDRAHAIIPLSAAEQTYVALTVSDTGQGIPADLRTRIFDPFFSTKFAGRGLGLSAVLGIVKAHQGTIALETAPGAGTTFTLLLPATDAMAPATDLAARPELRRGSGTILVIDDEATVRTVVQRTLEHHGYRVLLAEDGQKGVDMFVAQRQVIAVVLDLAMPVMGGDQAAQHLRRINPHIPIILSSGYPESEARQKFGGIGITSFLQKPYKAATLLERLTVSLGSKH